MTEPSPREPSAEDLYADFLVRQESGQPTDFEQWVAANVSRAEELRAIHADQLRLRELLELKTGATATASSFFHRSPGGGDEGSGATPGLPALQPGVAVSEFVLVRLIGRGGMGQVWEATQPSLGRRVALKLLKDQVAARARDVRRFKREAAAYARINHEGVVRVYAAGDHGGRLWIAQELVEDGSTLHDFLVDARERGEALPAGYARRVAALFAAIADALQAAHDAGVVHRDLKPQNILITRDDRPKVTDFGLARLAQEDSLSQSGDVAGTYLYMSPEQAEGRVTGLDHRTDVFSLGSTLYEALSLRRPFQADTPAAVLHRVLHADPPSLTPGVPGDLALICARAMAKRPEERYADMASFAADLRHFLRHEPIQARAAGPALVARKWLRRHRAPAAAVLLALVAGAAAGVFLLGRDGAPDAYAAWREPTVPPVPEGAVPWHSEVLRVYAADAELAALLADAEWATVLPERGEAGYDLGWVPATDGRTSKVPRLSTKDGLSVWTAQREVGRTAQAGDVAFSLGEAVRKEALWRGLYGLAEARGRLPLEASFGAVSADVIAGYRLDESRAVLPRPLAGASDLPPQFEVEGGRRTDPTYAALDVRNASVEPVYLTVLSLACDRSFNRIWPIPGGAIEPVGPGESAHVPVGVEFPADWPFEYPMRDRYVTFATRTPIALAILQNDLAVDRSGAPVLPQALAEALAATPVGATAERSSTRMPDGDWGICTVDLLVHPER